MTRPTNAPGGVAAEYETEYRRFAQHFARMGRKRLQAEREHAVSTIKWLAHNRALRPDGRVAFATGAVGLLAKRDAADDRLAAIDAREAARASGGAA